MNFLFNYSINFLMLIVILVYCTFIVIVEKKVEKYNADVDAFIDAMMKHFGEK
jgi:hypothetical protein